MNNRTKFEIAAGIIVAILLGLVVYQQFQKSVSVATAAIIAQHDQERDAKLTDTLKDFQKADEQRQKEYDAKSSSLRTLSPQQIVVKVPEYVPQAVQPIQIIPAGQPNAGDALVPAADIKPIAQALLDGQKCTADLASCSQAKQVWQDKYETKSDEAKRWETAAKGGSVWKRVGKVLLYVGVGTGIGYAAHAAK